MYWFTNRGFTIVELLVTISIIGVLSAIVLANMVGSRQAGRDALRQSSLRNVQSALEAYKQKNGAYPLAGCSVGSGVWATEKLCGAQPYIVGLAPEFIERLPRDPAIGTADGFAYVTNANRTVYKFMAMNTVEADILDYDHPFKSCDIDYGGGTVFPGAASGSQINQYGWCANVNPNGANGNDQGAPTQCRRIIDGGNGRFDKSYGVWGGFAPLTGAGTTARFAWQTTTIICK